MAELLPVLGDGAGRHNAEAAVEWAIGAFLPVALAYALGRLRGVSEAVEIIGTTRANVLRWSNGTGRLDFPAPVITLACGPHWDRGALADFASKLNDRSVVSSA